MYKIYIYICYNIVLYLLFRKKKKQRESYVKMKEEIGAEQKEDQR